MSARLADLETVTRGMCHAFLADCEERLFPPIRVTHTLRTLDEQLHLYAKGRKQTDSGWVVVDKKAVVTKAKPGESAHNFGAAFDICFAGVTPYPEDDALWESVGMVGEGCGLEWGGRWKSFVDRPHFQNPAWRTLRG